jgi:hypothetical protein
MSNIPDPPAFQLDDPSLIGEVHDDTLEIISAAEAPEYANARATSVLEDLSKQPTMAAPPDGQVELPGGLIGADGKVITTAIVRELTGEDEERLARINMRTQLPYWLKTMLLSAVEAIGTEKPTEEMLQNLLVGDREALILGIRIATYGNDMPTHLICPDCGKEQDVAIELSEDIPVKKLDNPEVREFEVELRRGRKAMVNLPTVAVQDAVVDPQINDAERKTETLVRCVTRLDGKRPNREDVRHLGLADRATLLNFLADHQPGPDYTQVALPCTGCERDFPLSIGLFDLFPG